MRRDSILTAARLKPKHPQNTAMQIGASSRDMPRWISPYLANQAAVPISAATYKNMDRARASSVLSVEDTFKVIQNLEKSIDRTKKEIAREVVRG